MRRTRKRSRSPWFLHSVNRLRCWQHIAPLWHSICIIMGKNGTGWLKEHAAAADVYRISTGTSELYRIANWSGKFGCSFWKLHRWLVFLIFHRLLTGGSELLCYSREQPYKHFSIKQFCFRRKQPLGGPAVRNIQVHPLRNNPEERSSHAAIYFSARSVRNEQYIKLPSAI